jgi:hypothetical protein
MPWAKRAGVIFLSARAFRRANVCGVGKSQYANLVVAGRANVKRQTPTQKQMV